MISTMVHAAFGNVLMLAGVTRIIEVCFIVPSFEKDSQHGSDNDSSSERTLAPSGLLTEQSKLTVVRSFRHLPPLVST